MNRGRAIAVLSERFCIFAGAQERFLEAQEAAQGIRGLFFAAVSHDLKSPLRRTRTSSKCSRWDGKLKVGVLVLVGLDDVQFHLWPRSAKKWPRRTLRKSSEKRNRKRVSSGQTFDAAHRPPQRGLSDVRQGRFQYDKRPCKRTHPQRERCCVSGGHIERADRPVRWSEVVT